MSKVVVNPLTEGVSDLGVDTGIGDTGSSFAEAPESETDKVVWRV